MHVSLLGVPGGVGEGIAPCRVGRGFGDAVVIDISRLQWPSQVREQHQMPHAILRGINGRRQVDFGDAPIRVEIHASDETVEIFVEADFETHAEERRRFVLLNIPRHLFSEASGKAARRRSSTSLPKRGNR